MSSPVTSRRAFVASALALALAPVRAMHGAAGDASPGCGHGRHARRTGPHPTPRPHVTAARVVPAAKLADESQAVRSAFDEVRQIPGIADGIRCQCGCADMEGSYSLLSCFEGDGMARHCDVCQGQARLAFRLHRGGRSLRDVRAAIDARYG